MGNAWQPKPLSRRTNSALQENILQPQNSSTPRRLMSIGQAAQHLGVSIDTLRNWEKQGKITPARTEGGVRRYSPNHLRQLQNNPPEILSIGQAAAFLGVSIDTLRNWEKQGKLLPIREEGSIRRYHLSQLKKFQQGKKTAPQPILQPQPVLVQPQPQPQPQLRPQVIPTPPQMPVYNVPPAAPLPTVPVYVDRVVSAPPPIIRQSKIPYFLAGAGGLIGIAAIASLTFLLINRPGFPDASPTNPSQTVFNPQKIEKTIPAAGNILSNIPNSALLNDSITISAGKNLLGGGNVPLGGILNLSLKDAPELSSITLGGGTVTTPAIAFTNDTNTGFYQPAADTLSLITGGNISHGITIDSSGQVGVGTTSPIAALDISGGIRLGASGSNNILNTSAASGAASGDLYWGSRKLSTGGSSSSSITIKGINGTPLAISGINTLEFDQNTGLHVADQGSNTARISIGSHWYTIYVDGVARLTPTGEENINFTSGSNFSITANSSSSPQALTFAVSQTPTFTTLKLDGTTTPASPVQGDIYSSSTDNKLYYHNGTSWIDLTAAASGSVPSGTLAGQTLYYNGASWATSTNLFNDNTNVGIGTSVPTSALSLAKNSTISVATSPGYDNGLLALTGSGTWDSARGATLALYGIDHATSPGDLVLTAGNSAGAVKFKTTGQERMRIDTTGNVGIGTTSPLSKLVINDSTLGNNINMLYPTPNDYGLDASASLQTIVGGSDSVGQDAGLAFRNEQSNRKWVLGMDSSVSDLFSIAVDNFSTGQKLSINTSGNVGIGTTNPINTLDVTGTGRFTSTANPGLLVGDGTTGYLKIGSATLSKASGSNFQINTPSWVNANSTGDAFIVDQSGSGSFMNVGTGKLFVTNAGNVGIGTTAPGKLLDLWGGDIRVKYTNNTDTKTIGFSYGTDTGFSTGISDNAGLNIFANSARPIIFSTNTTGLSGTERMRIDGGGNLGIGTTGPASKLEVAGTTKISGSSGSLLIDPSNAGYTSVVLSASSGNMIGTISDFAAFMGKTIRAYDSSSALYTSMSHNGTNGVLTTSAGSLILSPNSGNVGIGTTSPHALLSAGNSLGMKIASYDSTGTDLYGLGVQASLFESIVPVSSSDFTFGYGTSGSLTRLMTIKGTGNVGIGTTAPGAKLEVNGNIKVVNGALIGVNLTGNNQNFYMDTGTTNINAPSSTGIISFSRQGTEWARIQNGNVGIGTTLPSTQLEISSLAGADSTFSLSDGDVSHTFTSLASANTYLKAQPLSSTLGGTLLTGFSSGDSGAFQFKGLIGSVSPATSTPAFKFTAAISDGLGGLAAMGNTNTLFQIQNNTNTPSFTVFGNGSVGIGTTSPGYILDVQHATSKVNSKNGYLTNGADYAEWFASSDSTLSPGEVVSFDNTSISAKRSSSGYDKNLLGVVSTKPGYIGNNPFKSASEEEANTQSGRYKLIAMVGQVPVKVSLEGGIINVGDYLTSSTTEGVAMKAVRPGQVLGKALTSFDGSGCANPNGPFCQGTVTLLINVSYADPANFLAFLDVDNSGNLIIPNLKVEKLLIAQQPATDSLQTAGAAVAGSGEVLGTSTVTQQPYYDLSGKVAAMEDEMASYQAKVAALENQVASLKSLTSTASATPTEIQPLSTATPAAIAAVPTVSESTPSSQLALTPPDILMATGSATLANITVTSQASVSGKLTAYEASISDTFKSLGSTFLGNTIIAGDFTVDGTLSITEDSINSISTGIARNAPAGILYIQNSPLASAVDFFNGQVIIDHTGNLIAQTITAGEYKGTRGKVVGSGTITAGAASVDIDTPLVSSGSRILLTPTVKTNIILSVTAKIIGQKFTVTANNTPTADLTFDWFIVNEND